MNIASEKQEVKMQFNKLSVIIPAYNEGKNIFSNIIVIKNQLEKDNIPYELVIIDDGSNDNTYQEICKLKNKKVKGYYFAKNKGKAAALKRGYKKSTGDIIIFFDADLDLHPKLIKRFISYMTTYDVDVVTGSKRHPASKVHYPFTRRALSKFYQIFILLAFRIPLTDSQVGIKLFKKKVLDTVLPRVLVKKYAFDVELLVNIDRAGFRYMEAPIELNFKHSSTVKLSAISDMFIDTLAILYRTYILKYYDEKRMISKKPKLREIATLMFKN